jgi:outer membrane immunogenic protein
MKFAAYVVATALASSNALAGGVVSANADHAPSEQSGAGNDWTGSYSGIQLGVGSADASGFGVTVGIGDFNAFGTHFGYLQSFDGFVAGGEIDYNIITSDDAEGSANLWRLRARAGYALGEFLPYATFGIAHLSDSEISDTGFSYGVGADYAFTDSFSLGAEYNRNVFTDFAASELGMSGIDLHADLFQVRASFRF